MWGELGIALGPDIGVEELELIEGKEGVGDDDNSGGFRMAG
jgi:hypothetical protein